MVNQKKDLRMNVRYLIGKLAVPEHVQEWLKQNETYTIRIRNTVDSLSDEALNKTYRDGA